MADDVTEDRGVPTNAAEIANDPNRQVIAGPKDPEHGERPVEYQARVDAATTIKGPAHLEPTTTHLWGGNSEFRSTGVIPALPTLAGDLPARGHAEHDGELVLVEPVVERPVAEPALPEHGEPTEENTKPE